MIRVKPIILFLVALVLVISCSQAPSPSPQSFAPTNNEPIVIGYSSWVGWWAWAIAQEEGLFEKNGANVELRWYDSYLDSLEALANGEIDANSQTLNDTVSFAENAVNGEVVVLVNDNSAGNDKIIVRQGIDSVANLEGKDVAVEAGLVDDFLLSLALEDAGMSRQDVNVIDLETGAAAVAFATGQTDAVGAFPPFWLTALEREGSKELISSAQYPGAIPDLLVVSQELIDERPEQIQALIDTWWDIREFMEQNPERADEIMAQRAGISLEQLQLFKQGTRFFTVEDNLEAFSPGNDMQHLSHAAQQMADFMLEVEFIDEIPDLNSIFDNQFLEAYAAKN